MKKTYLCLSLSAMLAVFSCSKDDNAIDYTNVEVDASENTVLDVDLDSTNL